ncbi:RNA-binding protein 2-like protein [Drosera capensis]
MGRGVNRRGWYASEGGMLQHLGNVYEFAPTGLGVGYGFQQSVDTLPRPVLGTVLLPPNAASTLYVLGLPPDSTRREVAHIFRHFMGYKEVRLVTKPNKFYGENFVIIGFVKFENPAFGYVMDENVPSSPRLRIQFDWSSGRQHMTKEAVKGKAEETKGAVRETAGRAKDKAGETSSDGRS